MKYQTFRHLHLWMQVVLVFAVVIACNVVLSLVTLRWDLTDGKQYTLSEASHGIVQNVSSPITIKVFFSKELPQDLRVTRQDVEDLLHEYQRAGNGNVVVEYIDPTNSAEDANAARSFSIPEIQFNVVGNEKYEVSNGYAGLAILVGDQSDSIPVLPDVDNIEYAITSKIHRMTRTDTPTIGILSDHGVVATQNFQEALKQQYNVSSVTLDQLTNISALVLAGPTESFSDQDQYRIDQFVMNGGKLFVLLDGMKVDQQFLTVTSNTTGLENMLRAYGATIHNDIVADYFSAETLTFGGGNFSVLRQYAFWPTIVGKGLNSENPITSSLQSLVLPWASSINVDVPEGVKATVLASTSAHSYAYTELTSAYPENEPFPGDEKLNTQDVAVVLRGTLPSAFTTREKPADVDTTTFRSSTDQGAVFAVSDGDFVSDMMLSRSTENANIVFNALDVLGQDAAFVSIRARTSFLRPLQPLSDDRRLAIKYGNIFSSVVLVIIIASVMTSIRRRRDRRIMRMYHSSS